MLKTEPVGWVILEQQASAKSKIACPGLEHLRSLDADPGLGVRFSADGLVSLYSSPYLSNLVRLDSYQLMQEYTPDVARAISRMQSAKKLTHLAAGGPIWESEEFLAALCTGDGYPNLEHLAVGSLYHFDQRLEGLAYLSAPRLTSLRIIGRLPDAACANVARLHCSKLKRLALIASQISSDGFRILADAGMFEKLVSLQLGTVDLSADSLAAIFRGSQLAYCEELEIGPQSIEVGDRLMDALSSAQAPPALERLELETLETSRLARLFESSVAATIKSLSLMDMTIRTEDVSALERSPLRDRLRYLRISSFGKFAANAIKAFCKLHFPNLYCLDLTETEEAGCQFDKASIAQFLLSGAFPNLRELRFGLSRLSKTSAMVGSLLETIAKDCRFPQLRQISIREEGNSAALDRGIRSVLKCEQMPKVRIWIYNCGGADRKLLRNEFGARVAVAFGPGFYSRSRPYHPVEL